tara:strand:+ start:7563 stop:8213 length:651 start_codon:yes stop_codon:yes gene_type:complete
MKELLKKISDSFDIPYDELIKLQKNLTKKPTSIVNDLPNDLSVPYYGNIFNDQCKGIVYDHGLYTQCKTLTNNKFCKKCEKLKYGSIYDRSKFKLGEFVCNNGKKEINYIEYLRKNNINIDNVKEYFIKNNIPYEIKLDSIKQKNSTRGRPKKEIVKINNADIHNDNVEDKNSEHVNKIYTLDVEQQYINDELFYKTKSGIFLDSDLKPVDISAVR